MSPPSPPPVTSALSAALAAIAVAHLWWERAEDVRLHAPVTLRCAPSPQVDTATDAVLRARLCAPRR